MVDKHGVRTPAGVGEARVGTPAPGVADGLGRGGDIRVVVAVLAVLGAAMVVTFSVLLHDVVGSTGLAVSDLPTVRALAGIRGPVSLAVMRIVTAAGSPAGMCVLAAVVCGWLAWRRRVARPLIFGAAGVAGGALLDMATKYMVARPRPPVGLHAVTVNGYSFPSGHATFSGVVIPLCCVLLTRLAVPGRWARVALWSCASVMVVAVGFSRVFLGAHYPSDVLAGWSLAGAWDAVVVLAMVLIPTRRSGSVVSRR